MTPIRVIIADDDSVVRAALSALIDSEETLELVGVGGNADEAAELAGRLQPDVALVDVKMPGGGLRAVREIRRLSPETKILALSGSGDHETAQSMINAGATEYVVKSASPQDLLDAINR